MARIIYDSLAQVHFCILYAKCAVRCCYNILLLISRMENEWTFNVYVGEFACECNIGYMGPFCDLMRHPCDFKPCENGICEIVGDLYYKCLCKPNYTGVNCHIEIKPCDANTCLNGGRCRSLSTFDETDIGCDCPINFTGTICENEIIDQNPCASNPCHNNAICNTRLVDFQTRIECLCPEQFYGEFCENGRFA